MREKEEITATLHGEVFRRGEFAILEIGLDGGTDTKCKISAPEGELVEGMAYRFFGYWHEHRQFGPQFVAETFVEVSPHDRFGVVKYLQKADGIGPATARKLWKFYEGEAVRRLREDPVAVSEAVGARFSQEKAEIAAAYFEECKAFEDATIELVGLFAGRGFPKAMPRDLVLAWGNDAHIRAKRNPYALMKFSGVGFAKADRLYLELGKNPAAIKRQLLAIWYAMNTDSDGHTWFSPSFIEKAVSEHIGGAEANPMKAVRLGLRAGLLGKYRRGDTHAPYFSAAVRDQDERTIAERVAFLEREPVAWPTVILSDLSSHQQHELTISTSKPVGIFSGGPGTGKTYSAARLIRRVLELSGSSSVAVLAPTGKAAVRITEAMTENGIDIRARTIHSFLKCQGMVDGRFEFEHDETNRVDARYVLVDEASMVDVPTMAALLRAMRDDGHLLLIGDVNQLPPVGHGASLRDMIDAGVARGELREIRRNSGAIVETCAGLRDSKPLRIPTGALNPGRGRNLKLYETRPEEQINQILELVRKIRDRGLVDPVWDLQIICAVNESGPLARKALNVKLRLELNHRNRQPRGYWPNDKVVCLRNQFLPAVQDAMDVSEFGDDELEGLIRENKNGDPTMYIANGELGRVIEDLPNKCIMEFFSPRRVVLFPKKDGGEVEGFDLGYAVSCHKSQGSEWPVVIVGLDGSGAGRRVCDRAWLYTAISRAKTVGMLVGQYQTAVSMARTQKIHHRKTFLSARIQEERGRYIDKARAVQKESVESLIVIGSQCVESR